MFLAWDEFKRDKGQKADIALFEQNLEQNIFALARELRDKIYRHGPYAQFFINDPKRRSIHKSIVCDRVLHHGVFRVLYWVFDPTFVPTSFSCRLGRGTHEGVNWLGQTLRAVSQNHTRTAYTLKCDVKKFFDSVDHRVLLSLLAKKIKDPDLMWLFEEIIGSYSTPALTRERERESKIGLPIGNLTSQLFANIYLNEFDQFIKHELKVKHYARYTDDFVIIADNPDYLQNLLPPIKNLLANQLALHLHPDKVEIRKYHHGIDFLGYVSLPHYRLLRERTKKRLLRKLRECQQECEAGLISQESFQQSLNSYLGVLSHADTYHLSQGLKNQYGLLA